uniref:Integrase catalytic domain-containing protein n=1 Tax=Tanacetum cinerariifolium TaxID=118510 RepID=A0A6L2LE32_TANCI|nr:hypothetical protein [Tanacetum cinerariifolium]
MQPLPIPSEEDTQTDEKDDGRDEFFKRSLGSKPLEKVVIYNDYLDLTISIEGNLSAECRTRLIEMLRFPLDDRGRRSIPDNEEIDSRTTTLTAPKKEEELMVYLFAAYKAVSVVLLVKKDERQASIHYVNRTLHGAEVNYPPVEKLVLALVHAARRLRRLAKWVVEVEAYAIKYAPRSTIKGQVLADFLPDTMAEDSSTQEKASGPNDTLTEGESREEQKTLEATTPENLKVEADISNQVKGSYEAKGEKSKKYKEKALEMIRCFNDFQINHIPREENRKVDALSRLAAVQCEGLTKGVLIEELNERSMDTTEVNAVIEEAARTWMTPIREYIENKILPEDATKARTIQEKSRNYTIVEGILYRKSYLGPLLRCIGLQQVKYLIKKIHMGSSGMHDRPRRAVHKAMNAEFIWPSMHQDANNEISSCDSCQVYATVPKLPKNDITFVTSAWPFQKWGMDIVGPLPEAPGKIKYLIVAIDYFTK